MEIALEPDLGAKAFRILRCSLSFVDATPSSPAPFGRQLARPIIADVSRWQKLGRPLGIVTAAVVELGGGGVGVADIPLHVFQTRAVVQVMKVARIE
jgi:hypothetical protein